MHNGVIALAVALNVLSAVLFYLAAPRQQWLKQPLPARIGRKPASMLLILSLLLWLTQAQVVTSLFAVLTLCMVLFAILPYAAAWRSLRSAR